MATREGRLYLAIVLDLFSRKVLGGALQETLESSLASLALQRALRERRPAPGLCFHSDRGGQYGSAAVRAPLRVIKATQSMSAQGRCYDNATAEAFFSSFKTECWPSVRVFATKPMLTGRSSRTWKSTIIRNVSTAVLAIARPWNAKSTTLESLQGPHPQRYRARRAERREAQRPRTGRRGTCMSRAKVVGRKQGP